MCVCVWGGGGGGWGVVSPCKTRGGVYMLRQTQERGREVHVGTFVRLIGASAASLY